MVAQALLLLVGLSGWANAQHEHHHAASAMPMTGMYGPYPMSREGMGTSWQPDSTPHEGPHLMEGPWRVMVHGFLTGVYDDQGGPRGDEKAFTESMVMAMAQRPLWGGTFGLRGMGSLDPTMGKNGYPLLLQTGETADGSTPLVDRQHPHDFFMELAGTYSHPLGEDGSVFGYLGLAGEPALGPPVFMQRFSGMMNPEAPITHHWLDSTHITYGVATLGWVRGGWKLEGSSFRGSEPDQHRWDIEKPEFDSFSGRLSFNPTEDWALQASYGRLRSPEQLEPDVDVGRFTASASYNLRLGRAFSQTTFCFGSNHASPGHTTDAFLLESAVRTEGGHNVFGRFETAEKDELFIPGAHGHEAFTVHKLSLGYAYDIAETGVIRWSAGVVGAFHFLPHDIRPAYGSSPVSFMLFVRTTLI